MIYTNKDGEAFQFKLGPLNITYHSSKYSSKTHRIKNRLLSIQLFNKQFIHKS